MPRPLASGAPPRVLAPRVLALRALALALFLPALAGCFQIRALVRVQPDGSGTVEETITLSDALLGLIASADTAGAFRFFDEDSLRAHAARLGPGVRFVRVDSVGTDSASGYRAVYAFDDVAALRFRFNPNPFPGMGGNSSGSAAGNPLGMGTDPASPVTFALAREGGAATLRVRMPQPAPSEGPPPALDPAEVAVAAQGLRRQFSSSDATFREMVGGIHVGLAVEVGGAVTRTDAANVEGATLTLIDLPFSEVIGLMGEKPELVARMQLLQRQGYANPRPLQQALVARPGVRYELQPEVSVTFER